MAMIWAARDVWQRRTAELCAKSPRPQGTPRLISRPSPLRQGPVERYADGAWNVSLGGFAVGIADTQTLSSAMAPLVDAVPKPAHRGREVFATQLHRVLADRGIVCRQAHVLRRLDRIDTVVTDAVLLLDGTRRLGKVVLLDSTGLQEIRQHAGWLFDGQDPSATRENDGWKLGPLREQREELRDFAGEPLGLWREGTLVAAVDTIGSIAPAGRDLMAAVRRAGLALVLANESNADVSSLTADRIADAGQELTDIVLEHQKDGRGVALVSAIDSDALAASDCGIGLCQPGKGIPWGAHLLCGAGLDDVTLIIESIATAREVSRQSADLSLGGSAVGALLTVGGLQKTSTGRVKAAVNAAATISMLNGIRAARRLHHAAITLREDTPWHALPVEDVLERVQSARDGLSDQQAAQRLPRGANDKTRGPNLLRAIVGELDNPLTPILGAGAVAAAGIGSAGDAAIVGAASSWRAGLLPWPLPGRFALD